ncbi:MAG: hypothetical protein V2I97_06080, partial [Desulfococcaceae bacterium]|nr:hypothetical protein [Desulfococcaceae bacterium]
QGRSGFRHFTRWVKSVKQAKFRLPDIQPVYLKKTAQFRFKSFILNSMFGSFLSFQKIQSYVPYNCKILSTIAFTVSGIIFTEDYIQNPMERIFNRPVLPACFQQIKCVCFRTRKIITMFN